MLARSTDLGELRFTAILLFYSPATLQARWTELNQNQPHLRKWVRFENVCPKSEVCPPQTTCFRRLCHLIATLMAYIFGMKHDIHNRASALETTRGLLHRLKILRILVHKRLKRPSFLPTLSDFCILYTRRSAKSKHKSTKLCDILETKQDLQIHVKIWGVTPKNWVAKIAYFVTVFISTKLWRK